MTALVPDTGDNLSDAVAQSITDFFVSTVGAEPCSYDERPVAGSVHAHFFNGALAEPLSFVLPETRVGDAVRAHATLLATEPIQSQMFIERYRVDSSDAHAHLDFLSEKLPVSCCKDLLALKHPQRPIDVMRNRLVSYAAETERGIPIGENRTHAMRASVESLLYDVVARYYAVVDRAARNDIAEIVSMFSKHGVYDRAGKLLRGRREIAEFYTTERTLEGVHVVHSLVVDQLLAHVTGIFEGRSNASDSQRRLEFADTWRFDLHGYVTFRHTYLSAGHQLTT